MRAIAFIVAVVAVTAAAGAADPDVSPRRGPVPEPLRLGPQQLAVPAIGPPPEWYTEEVFARAVEASERGLLYDAAAGRAIVPAAAPAQILIRPGAQILPESIFPGWCTAAFVFDSGRKIATAGHCTRKGDRVLALAAPSTVFVIGRTASSTGPKSKLGNDWALISIDPAWQPFVDAATALVGGPCGRASRPSTPLLKYVGHGAVIGTGGTARVGLLDLWGLSDLLLEPSPAFAAVGLAYAGDSGAPVLETTQAQAGGPCAAGGAFGILTHIAAVGLAGEPLVPTGFFFGTPISRIGASLTSANLEPLP